MKEKLAARLFDLQKKLAGIKFYDEESGKYLFKCSIEFERVLLMLLNYNQEKFSALYDDYNSITERTCCLACDFNDKNNQAEAFYSGLEKLDSCLSKCLIQLQETDNLKAG